MLQLFTKKTSKKLQTLLKQIHLLDLIFLGVFFALLFFFITILARSDKEILISVKVTDQNIFSTIYNPTSSTLLPEYVQSLSKGDVERNEVGKVLAEITQVHATQSHPFGYTTYLDLKVSANYNPLKKQYSYKGRPIIFGQEIEFHFNNVRVLGQITDFPGHITTERTPVKLKIYAQLRDESRSYADTYGISRIYQNAVSTGDLLTSNDGETIIKILDVKSEPAKRTIISQGQSLVVNDAQLIDLFYTLEVNGFESEGRTYLSGYIPVRVGATIPLTNNKAALFPTILTFEKI